jgi:hypothetical protein
MLLTWHKNNNFPNLWLDLHYQLEEENIYKNKYIHQIYNNGLLKLKNMDWFAICVFIYMHFVYEFYLEYIMGIQYMIYIYIYMKQNC